MISSIPFGDLSKFKGIPCVFDKLRSEINTLPGHRISMVLPWIDEEETMGTPVIIEGTVSECILALGKEVSDFEMGKEFIIHGHSYNMSSEVKALHEKGVAELNRYRNKKIKPIVGAKPPSLPKVLYLDQVQVICNCENFTPNEIKNNCARIGKLIGREIRVTNISNSTCTLLIPGSWILQDLTAIHARNVFLANGKNGTHTDVIPIIEIPAAFPVLKSKISFNKNSETILATIEDYDIVFGGEKLEVLLTLDDGSQTFLLYSNLYADSMASLLNPAINNIITPLEQANIKKTYLAKCRKYFLKRLSQWNIWKICTGKKAMRVLASEKGKNGEKQKHHWLLPEEAISRKDLNISSFETGEVISDGIVKEIVYIRDHQDDTVHFNDIRREDKITSLIFNAVNGHAEFINGTKHHEYFFSTRTCEDISIDTLPLFAPKTCTARPVIDYVNLKYFLGYAGKSKEKGHEAQTVVYWTPISDSFRKFYIWIVSKGTHLMFKDKKVSEIRTMFKCNEFPLLVEMYNLLHFGYCAKNPTRNNKWTLFFLRSIFCINPSDLI